jgi:mannose-6-phosphate isomerase
MILSPHLVEKPWGRNDLPLDFGARPDRQTGEIWYESGDGAALPLLVKWLFTSEKLSIQVHPSDLQAKERGLPSGKEECWYIVDAEPGAVLGIGTKRPLAPEELRATSLSGEIEALMDWKPVKAGDWYYIPAGTIHAIGAGITLIEVQQYADITYRLYDYGRPRELHLGDGVAVAKPVPYADPRCGTAQGSAQLIDGPHFRLWLINGDDGGLALLPDTSQRWIIPVKGTVMIDGQTILPSQCLLDESNAALSVSAGGAALIAMV